MEEGRLMASFTGFGLYWAWLWLLFFTATIVPSETRSLVEANGFRCLGLAVEAAAFLVLVLDLVRKDPFVFKRGVDNTVACILGVVGTLGVMAGGVLEEGMGLAVYASGWVLWGVAGAFLTLTWGRILDSLSTRDICLYLALSMALGAMIALLATLLPTPIARAVTLGLPAASVLLGHRAKSIIRSDDFRDKVPPAPVTDPKIMPAPLLRILFGVAAYSAVTGIVLGMMICREGGGFDAIDRLALFSPLAVGLAIALIIGLRKSPRPLATLYRFCMPAIITGLIVLSVANESHSAFACAIVVMGFQAFDITVMIVLFDGSRHYQNLSIRAFLMGRFANVTGLTAGWALGAALVLGYAPSVLTPSNACLVAVLGITLATAMTLLEKDLFPRTSSISDPAPAVIDQSGEASLQDAPPARDPDDALADIARKHGLSAQETRVFLFLAKGYSRKTIQEKLFIASATVDSHVAHIYRKMGIHSRQELINLAESALSPAGK